MTGALERRLADIVPAERLGRWTDAERALPLVAPGSEEGWRACLRLAHAEGHRVHPVGGGTKSSWCPVPEGTELVLSSAAWQGVVAYEPADGTLTARSGSRMESLRAAVAEGGHALSPDVPLPERATLGGVVAAGQSGFDRLRHGGIRDALLGTLVLLADGRSSKSGGRLVKNVTGYDLHRLWCGSRGSLCVVLEASLRLHAAPREHRSLVFDATDAEGAFAAALRLYAAGADLRPAAVCVHDVPAGPAGSAGGAALLVALCGRSEVVAAEEARLRELLPAIRPAATGDASWNQLRDRGAALASLELQTTPERCGAAVALAREAAAPFVLTAHPLVGSATLSFPAGTDLHPELERLAAVLPPRVRVLVRGACSRPPAGRLPAAARAMMERLEQGYDPTGVFAGGVPA